MTRAHEGPVSRSSAKLSLTDIRLTPTPRVGPRPYFYRGLDWSDPVQVNAYKRAYTAAWRARRPELYDAAKKRWRYNAKLRECGVTISTNNQGEVR